MLSITVTTKKGRQQIEHAAGPLEFGRGHQRDGRARVVIEEDLRVSRDHMCVEELPGGRVRLDNLSLRNPIRLDDNTVIQPEGSAEANLPVALTMGETLVEIGSPTQEALDPSTLSTLAQSMRGSSPAGGKTLLDLDDGGAPTAERLAQWFETVIAVQRAAAGSPEFYQQTAQALVDLVGLDRGLVLLRQGERWGIVASAGPDEGRGRGFSHTILDKVVQEGRTFFQTKPTIAPSASMEGIEAVVAAPVFDAQDRVIGVLYGSRTRFTPRHGPGIGPLEAQVVQLLAAAVGAGLARLEQEAAATHMRVQFEQFFTPYLTAELQRNPRLLEGQEREITILFSDIRGFSRLAERLSPHDTCRLVSAVMERLTVQVRDHEGVVTDYIGDGLMAMWNAPAHHEDHALLACRAALAMLAQMPQLSVEWQPVLGEPLRLGIGLNTGTALVGNTGSRLKFKYGALGHNVNLASRVEGATKSFGVPILITGTTQAQIGDSFATRRLCRVRVVGVTQPIDLFELHAEKATTEWLAFRDTYETALALFEEGKWAESCRALYPMLAGQEGKYDVPALDLLSRSVACLKSPPEKFEPVLELASK